MRIRDLVVGPLLLVALAGCGTAPDGDQVASAGGPASSTAPAPDQRGEHDAVLEYAACMRDNGVPDFPDPELGDNGEAQLGLPDGIDPAAVEAADRECKHLMPNGGEPKPLDPEVAAKVRAYAKCMRDNGIAKFPDPGPDGGIQIEGGPGLDPMSEEFKAAEEKCRTELPDGGRGASTHQEGSK